MAREADASILHKNFCDYFDLAEQALHQKKYNPCVVLFFKAIGAAADMLILKTAGRVPSSHAERFRMLSEEHQEAYTLLDKDYPFYHDSYTKELSEETAEVLKKDAQRLKKMLEE